LSAAVIVLAGSIIFAAGAFVAHNGTQGFVMVTGGVLCLIGLGHWIGLIRRPPE
jgi:hypothetical protein